MSTRTLSAAVLAMMIGLAMSAAAAHARAVGHIDRGPVYLDSARCDVLAQQFEQAATGRDVKGQALRLAARGDALCHAGDFAQGADTLAGAVRLIGETPAAPPSLRPLA